MESVYKEANLHFYMYGVWKFQFMDAPVNNLKYKMFLQYIRIEGTLGAVYL